jgi:hypothetical protein
MVSSRQIDAFVRRLEHGVAQAIEGRDRVPLAYSGGLASTLVAMLARKRCALDCVVAGVDGSSDVLAGKAAKAHLDYRVEYVILGREDATRIRARIAVAHPGLLGRDLDNLVPLHAALERVEGRSMLSGFGLPPLSHAMVVALGRMDVASPIRAASRGTTLSRSTLRAAATALGLPSKWARTAHRAPAEGAGIRDYFRASNRAPE